jgi:hypothetical protein
MKCDMLQFFNLSIMLLNMLKCILVWNVLNVSGCLIIWRLLIMKTHDVRYLCPIENQV